MSRMVLVNTDEKETGITDSELSPYIQYMHLVDKTWCNNGLLVHLSLYIRQKVTGYTWGGALRSGFPLMSGS